MDAGFDVKSEEVGSKPQSRSSPIMMAFVKATSALHQDQVYGW